MVKIVQADNIIELEQKIDEFISEAKQAHIRKQTPGEIKKPMPEYRVEIQHIPGFYNHGVIPLGNYKPYFIALIQWSTS